MSESGELGGTENPSGYNILPKDVTNEIGSIKLFNKWTYEDVEVRDISLTYDDPLFLEHLRGISRYHSHGDA